MALRYQPTSHGEYVPGYPRDWLTDEWLAERAHGLGCAVAEVVAQARAWRRADGRPLYARAGAPPPPPGRPPSVPLGMRPRG